MQNYFAEDGTVTNKASPTCMRTSPAQSVLSYLERMDPETPPGQIFSPDIYQGFFVPGEQIP
jgi:hypothetical protein